MLDTLLVSRSNAVAYIAQCTGLEYVSPENLHQKTDPTSIPLLEIAWPSSMDMLNDGQVESLKFMTMRLASGFPSAKSICTDFVQKEQQDDVLRIHFFDY